MGNWNLFSITRTTWRTKPSWRTTTAESPAFFTLFNSFISVFPSVLHTSVSQNSILSEPVFCCLLGPAGSTWTPTGWWPLTVAGSSPCRPWRSWWLGRTPSWVWRRRTSCLCPASTAWCWLGWDWPPSPPPPSWVSTTWRVSPSTTTGSGVSERGCWFSSP